MFQKQLTVMKGGIYSNQIQTILQIRNTEKQYCPPRTHPGNGKVERAIQTMKNLILANMEGGNNLTESVNRALGVMQFTKHTKENTI